MGVWAQLLHLGLRVPGNRRVVDSDANDDALLVVALIVYPAPAAGGGGEGGVLLAGVEVHLEGRVDRKVLWQWGRGVWRWLGAEVADQGLEFCSVCA